MLTSVIVGDMAGIVKFWAARALEQQRRPTVRIPISLQVLIRGNVKLLVG